MSAQRATQTTPTGHQFDPTGQRELKTMWTIRR